MIPLCLKHRSTLSVLSYLLRLSVVAFLPPVCSPLGGPARQFGVKNWRSDRRAGLQVPLCLVCSPTPAVGRVSHSSGLGGSQTSPKMTVKPKLLLSYPLPNTLPPSRAQKHVAGQASVPSAAIAYLPVGLFNRAGLRVQ